jgi:hypothetical protein
LRDDKRKQGSRPTILVTMLAACAIVTQAVMATCLHQVAETYQDPSCDCTGRTNGAECACIQFSSQQAPPGPNDYWVTYGTYCKDDPYCGMNCEYVGTNRRYSQVTLGNCPGGTCDLSTPMGWKNDGLKAMYRTVQCP